MASCGPGEIQLTMISTVTPSIRSFQWTVADTNNLSTIYGQGNASPNPGVTFCAPYGASVTVSVEYNPGSIEIPTRFTWTLKDGDTTLGSSRNDPDPVTLTLPSDPNPPTPSPSPSPSPPPSPSPVVPAGQNYILCCYSKNVRNTFIAISVLSVILVILFYMFRRWCF